jgi:hypothetical protein
MAVIVAVGWSPHQSQIEDPSGRNTPDRVILRNSGRIRA